LLLYFLRRKELSLETGDAWSSFYTNLAKRSLLKLNTDKTETRNWRPNIILFRGKQQERPHLVELGLAMSGKLGALTDFELIIDDKPEKTNIKNGEKKDLQYFRRQHVCNSIEDGIKSVTSIYGFSGFEPNTVLMGWSHDTKNVSLLASIFTDLKKKNLNAAFLDFDKENGFGKKENIDIWWNGKGRLLSFALGVMKFILSDPDWRDANIRILIINSDNQITDKLYRNTNALLNEKRIYADVKIIHDDFGTRNKEIIIKNESADADLVVMGISPNPDYYNEKYIEEFNRISELTSSLLILNPSNEFEEINLITLPQKTVLELPKTKLHALPALPEIENKLLQNRITKLDEELNEITGKFVEQGISRAVNRQSGLIKTLQDQIDYNIKNAQKYLENQKGVQLNKSFTKNHQSFLEFARDFFQEQCKLVITDIKESLENEISVLKTKTGNYIYETPESIIIPLEEEPNQKEKNISVPSRKIVSYVIHNKVFPEIENHLTTFEQKTALLYKQLKDTTLKTNDIYEKRESDKINFAIDLQEEHKKINIELDKLKDIINDQVSCFNNDLDSVIRNEVILIASDILDSKSKRSLSRKYSLTAGLSFEGLESFPENWENNINKYNSAAQLDFQILYEQKIIYSIIQNCIEKINSLVTENIFSQAEIIFKNIENWKSEQISQIKNIKFPEKSDTTTILQETYLKIIELLERLPSEIDITDFSYSENEEFLNLENAKTITVHPDKIAKYYLDTQLYDPLYRELEQLDKMLQLSIIEFKEANSLLKFRLENTDPELLENQTGSDKNLSEFLISTEQLIKEQNQIISELLDNLKHKAEEFVKNAVSPLYSHSIIESQNNFSVLLREQKGKKFGDRFSKSIELTKENVSNFVVDLLYSSSTGIIQAKRYLKKSEQKETSVGQILEFVENETSDYKILTQIPVFYRTLFSSKSLINDDFWIPMENELNLLKNALQRHRNGVGGAVLITGVHGSGKTTLSRFFTKRQFKKGQIFLINPPSTGSVKKEDWLHQLQRGTGINGGSFDILGSLPHGSTLIFNDLELWWERTTDGYVVLEEIFKLIRYFGKKVFFILNSNYYSIAQISKVFPVNENLQQVIECEPFDAKRIRELIHRRHKTSGLTYIYKNISEEDVSQISLASLFSNYFSYSGGIPGVAINTWLNHIEKIDKQTIHIRKPEIPDINFLNNINPDWLIIIAMFIQHKKMNIVKLARILNCSIEETENNIYYLLNARVLHSPENDAYELERSLEPFLVKLCIEKGII